MLALLGSTTEALEHLTDAAELMAGLHETESCTHYDHDLLCACIIGTRGIALVVAGSLDEAERQLRDAYERGTPHLESTDAVIVFEQQHLAAEQLWWMASIAEKRGDTTRRIDLLRQSSRFANTPYGDKARKALGPGPH